MTDLSQLNKDWSWLLVCFGAIIAYDAGKSMHWSVGVFTFLVLVNALGSNPTAMASAFTFLMFVYFFSMLGRLWGNYLPSILDTICIVSVLLTLYQLVHVTVPRMGISNNISMNGCLIAVTLPATLYVQSQKKAHDVFLGILNALAVVAILSVHASVPIGVLFVVLTSWCIAAGSGIGWLSLFSGLLFGVGYYLEPAVFFSSSGRLAGWQMIVEWWWATGKIFMGLGTGMGAIVFDQERQANPAFSHMAIWAHNDYLQVMFDNGLIGLGALLLVVWYAMKRSFNRPWLFASVVGYAATAFFNFPVHLPIHAFVGAALLWLAHHGEYA